jgi:hypothetical protein
VRGGNEGAYKGDEEKKSDKKEREGEKMREVKRDEGSFWDFHPVLLLPLSPSFTSSFCYPPPVLFLPSSWLLQRSGDVGDHFPSSSDRSSALPAILNPGPPGLELLNL